jgi:hypothetical protein
MPNTADSVAALRAVLQQRKVAVVPVIPGEATDETLARFLRARKHNVSKAAAMYAADRAWRDARGVAELRALSGSEVLGCDARLLQRVLPHWHGGADRAGHPLIFKHMGAQCRIRQMLSHASLDSLARYNVWLSEQYLDALAARGARRWTVVIDAAGWHVGLFDMAAFRFLRNLAATDADHYPELLHAMVIVNAPPMLATAWRVIRTWLDDETREKIDIISEAAPEQARARLHKLADPAQLPEQYGGTAPPLADWPARSGVARQPVATNAALTEDAADAAAAGASGRAADAVPHAVYVDAKYDRPVQKISAENIQVLPD